MAVAGCGHGSGCRGHLHPGKDTYHKRCLGGGILEIFVKYLMHYCECMLGDTIFLADNKTWQVYQ